MKCSCFVIVPIKLKKATLIGLNATSHFTINGILEKRVDGEIEEFLTHLAVKENVAASTQNQALNAILFLYRKVLKQELDLKELDLKLDLVMYHN